MRWLKTAKKKLGQIKKWGSHGRASCYSSDTLNPVDTGSPSVSTLGEKGSSAINQAINMRKDSIHTVPGKKVYKDCRRKYCKPHQVAKDTKQEESKPSKSGDRCVLTCRLSEEGVSFKTDCFFCGRPAKFGRKRQDVLQVKTIGLKDTILAT